MINDIQPVFSGTTPNQPVQNSPANEPNLSNQPDQNHQIISENPTPPPKPKKSLSSKQKTILIISAIIIVLLTSGILLYAYWAPHKAQNNSSKKPILTPTSTPTPVPTPVVVESQLDGTMVNTASAARHPLAIMVENHPQARPQSGLIDASIVYETLAEGGITRFMGIFGPKLPTQVGPIRSARTYYVDWAEEFDAFYAHYGGAPDALRKIPADGVKDLNGMQIGAAQFWRHTYPGVTASEHTAFTNAEKLFNYSLTTKKWANSAPASVYKFKDDPTAAEKGKGGTLTVNFSGNATYIAKFVYDPTTNTWPRTLAGVAHKDRISGLQIAPKNIIVQTASEIYKKGKKDHDVQTTGSGNAKFFLDGKMTTGTWSKADSKSRTIFKDSTGAQIVLNRGQTWIAVVKPGAAVIWTPAP